MDGISRIVGFQEAGGLVLSHLLLQAGKDLFLS